MKRSAMTDDYGIPLGRVLAGANRHDSPLLAPTLDLLGELGPLPDEITAHPDAGYDSDKSRAVLDERRLRGQIARKRTKAPVQATRRWHVERAHAWQNAPPPRPLLRTPHQCRRSLLRPRRHGHHHTQSDPPGLDHPPLGHPPPTPTMADTHLRGFQLVDAFSSRSSDVLRRAVIQIRSPMPDGNPRSVLPGGLGWCSDVSPLGVRRQGISRQPYLA